MINFIKNWSGIVALLIVAVIVVAGLNSTAVNSVGGTTNYDDLSLSGDLTVGDDVTISGGAVVLTTSNSATSTLTVGNIQTYATSTATAICLIPSTLGATSSFNGTLYFKYGTCPYTYP